MLQELYDKKIEALIEVFVQDIAGFVREEVLAAFAGRAEPTMKLGVALPDRLPRVPGILAKGEKRDPAVIARLTAKLLDYVIANSEQTIEAIGEGMGIHTNELKLPVKKLIATRFLSTRGQKRATRYYAAGA